MVNVDTAIATTVCEYAATGTVATGEHARLAGFRGGNILYRHPVRPMRYFRTRTARRPVIECERSAANTTPTTRA